MASQKSWWMSRREALKILGLSGTAIAASSFLPERVFAQARKNTLVLGIDISDTITLDPARLAQYTSPMTVATAYDSLVTLTPGDYIDVKPSLATKWARTPDGKGWRFTLRDGVKFASGTPMEAEDIAWSITRVMNLKDQPSQYIGNIEKVVVVDKSTIDVILKDPAQPILNVLAAPEFVAMERKVLMAKAAPPTRTPRKRTRPHRGSTENLPAPVPIRWRPGSATRRSSSCATTITGAASCPIERIVIRHISDGAAQLLAVRRGDIDAAFNLIPEQINSLKSEKDVRLDPLKSLDFVYMALTQNPEFNTALAVKECRQAIGYAIDYDGIKNSMLGGAALRPAHYPPIGVIGSTEEIARQIGFRNDPAKAKELLAKGGHPNGFEFEISYGNAAVQGVTYQDARAEDCSPISAAWASRLNCARWTRSICGPSIPAESRRAAC